MAETEIPSSPSRAFEAPHSADAARPAIAISEENLLALLGSSAVSATASRSPSSAPAQTNTAVESPLAQLSAVQAPAVQAPAVQAPAVQAHAVPSPADQPKVEEPGSGATPAPPPRPMPQVTAPHPVAAPNRAVPLLKVPTTQPAPGSADSALALLAAIKETRAGLLRSEAAAKPAPRPAPFAPAAQAEPPAEAQKTEVQQTGVQQTEVRQTKVPAPLPAAAPDLASSVTPAPPPITERMDRYRAMPASRNSSIRPGTSFQSIFLQDSPPQSDPAPSRLLAAIDKLPGGRTTLLIAGVLIAVGGVSTGLVLRSHRTEKPRVAATAPVPAAPPANNFPLHLQLEPQSNRQINVRWNPQSTLISQAREGRLVITESNQKPQTVPLSLDQLKSGHLTYQPLTERAEFRLEVVDASGSVAEESALSAANTPAPGANATPSASAAGNSQAPPPASTQKIAAPPAPAAAEASKGSRPVARVFTPPTQNRAPDQGAIIDAPPVLITSVAAPAALPNVQVPRAAAPPPPAGNAPAPRPLQVESSLQAVKLIKKVAPVYPPLAESARVQGTVHFKATIGKDGAVQSLEVVSGPAMLRQAATDAVKQWKYHPTILNGQPVDVITSIDVLFTLAR